MDTQQLLVGLTAINVMLVATAWTGAAGPSRRSDPKVIRAQSIELVDESEPAISLATRKPGTSITLVGAGRKRQVIRP